MVRDSAARRRRTLRPTSRIDIDLTAIDENLAAWHAALGPGVAVCPVVKADAYGLGAVTLTRRLVQRGVRTVAVYSDVQALELADAIGNASILILMPVDQLDAPDALRRMLADGRAQLTIHGIDHLDRVEAIGRGVGRPVRIHLEIDTGMARGGMSPSDAARLLESLPSRRHVHLAGIFSHAACPDTDFDRTLTQLESLEALYARFAPRLDSDVVTHFAGTFAALRGRRFHQSMVRLGRGLFGFGFERPVSGPVIEPMPVLRPAVRWLSRVVHVRQVPADTPVGYHGAFTTTRKTLLGLVPVGHADGYAQTLGGRGVVRAGPAMRPAPVIGEINMDQTLIDLTDVPRAAAGLEVEVIAADPQAPNALHRIAALAGTGVYELLCRLSPRVPRRYLHGGSAQPTIRSVSATRALGV